MLVDRQGMKTFHEYPLNNVFESQNAKLLDEIKKDLSAGLPTNENDYLATKEAKYRIAPLTFLMDSLSMQASEKMIPAEYFPSGFNVQAGKEYPKQVLSFHLPFTGDPFLLRCIPSPHTLWTEEVEIIKSHLVFDLINFNDDTRTITGERDRILKYLQTESSRVSDQVTRYNETLHQTALDAITNIAAELKKRSDFLAQLGTPVKDKSTITANHKPAYQPPNASVMTIKQEVKKHIYDVFICHASEDKEFVRLLAEEIKKAGMDPWYDNFQIGWGDDLRPTIDNGLKNSRYGIVVLSKAFLSRKKWTEYELNGLFAREQNGVKVILPIWHNITREDILQYSPSLADRLAKTSESIPDIINDLKKLLGK